MTSSKKKWVTADEFDRKFEEGEDLTEYMNFDNVQVNMPVLKRINIEIPQNILQKLDEQAKIIGVARTALIKLWLAEKLEVIH